MGLTIHRPEIEKRKRNSELSLGPGPNLCETLVTPQMGQKMYHQSQTTVNICQ